MYRIHPIAIEELSSSEGMADVLPAMDTFRHRDLALGCARSLSRSTGEEYRVYRASRMIASYCGGYDFTTSVRLTA